MPLKVQIYAPSFAQQSIVELTRAIQSASGSAVAYNSEYGKRGGRKSATISREVYDILAGIDLTHYAAVLNVYLRHPVTIALVSVVSPRIMDAIIAWIKKYRQGRQKVKVRLYKPDGSLLSDEDF